MATKRTGERPLHVDGTPLTDDEWDNLIRAEADRDYWESIAPEGYRLMGFTYRDSALFSCPDDRNTINITGMHVDFFKTRD